MKKFILLIHLFILCISVQSQSSLEPIPHDFSNHNFKPTPQDFVITTNGNVIDSLDKVYFHYKLIEKTGEFQKVISSAKYTKDNKVVKINYGELHLAVMSNDTFYYHNIKPYITELRYNDTVLRSDNLFNFMYVDSILSGQKIFDANNDINLAAYNTSNDGNILFLRIKTDNVLKFNIHLYNESGERFYKSNVNLFGNTVIPISISYLPDGNYKLNITNFESNKWVNFTIDRSK